MVGEGRGGGGTDFVSPDLRCVEIMPTGNTWDKVREDGMEWNGGKHNITHNELYTKRAGRCCKIDSAAAQRSNSSGTPLDD